MMPLKSSTRLNEYIYVYISKEYVDKIEVVDEKSTTLLIKKITL